jgi:hypothetical protein
LTNGYEKYAKTPETGVPSTADIGIGLTEKSSPMVRGAVAVSGVGSVESETSTMNADELADVGVPLITPAGDSVSPVGKLPLERDHVYGNTPPEAARSAVYGCPTVSCGRDVVATANGVGTMLDPYVSA